MYHQPNSGYGGGDFNAPPGMMAPQSNLSQHMGGQMPPHTGRGQMMGNPNMIPSNPMMHNAMSPMGSMPPNQQQPYTPNSQMMNYPIQHQQQQQQQQGIPQPQQQQQQAQPAKDVAQEALNKILSEPIEKVSNLVRQDLKSTLIKLMRTTKDVMTHKVKNLSAAPQSVSQPTEGTPAPSSVKSNLGTEEAASEAQQMTPGEITGPDSIDSKPPSVKASDKQHRSGSPTRAPPNSTTAILLRRSLEQFHTVCDQTEHYFALIAECQKMTRMNERHHNSLRSPGETNVTMKQMVASDVRFQSVIQQSLAKHVKKLDEIGSSSTEFETATTTDRKRSLEPESPAEDMKRIKTERIDEESLDSPANIAFQRPSVTILDEDSNDE